MNDPALAVAERAARNAAAVIGDAARDLKRLATFSKEHGEIVSQAESEAENAIVTALSAAFPDHAVLGGDGGARSPRNGGSTYRWIIDPIDGTANFAHGYPCYAISIALAHGAELTHAVVLDPLRDELYAAVKGHGATINGVPLRVSACTAIDRALVGTVFPAHDSPKLAAYLPMLQAVMQCCAGVRRAGASSLELAYVAAGRLDGFWVTSLTRRDLAAGALLVHEAGGRIGDFAGTAEFLKSGEVIAAAPGVFSALREVIAGAR
ncbi:MAG TPA: inositol monophosphatase family protein [Casimicrobiaceae bacterium]|nr:inositol monophosphatase family protein [Casimicrobiaceae bacterium]